MTDPERHPGQDDLLRSADVDAGIPQEPVKPVRPHRRPPRVSAWVVLGLLAVIFALIYRYRLAILADIRDPNAQPRAVTPRGELADIEKSQVEIFHLASPSVVHITTLLQPGPGQPVRPYGTGTGFVWREDGYIVTNYHVSSGSNPNEDALSDFLWQVTLADNSSYAASYVGGEPSLDVAVLKIPVERGQLTAIDIGRSADLQVGQNVYAIGSPFGLDQTLTTGVISGLGREIQALNGEMIYDVIQTDAAINPGNSGGPLLDSAGRAIGVNTAIFSPTGTNAGIGFAIPIDAVNRIVPELIRTAGVEKPALGILIRPDSIFAQLKLRGIEGLPDSGVMISAVVPGSSAEKAGLRGDEYDPRRGVRLGDVIVGLDGVSIEQADDLFAALKKYEVGDVVKVAIIRDGAPMTIDVTLQPRPGANP